MSLRVWLPLNGSLKNQGLDKVTVTNNGATIDNNGKIGKCYSFDGSNDYITVQDVNLPNVWSYSCWLYSEVSSRSWEVVITCNINGGDADMQLGLYTRPSGNNIQNTANGQYNASIPMTYGQWNHFVGTFDGSNLKTYLNGILVNTKAITNTKLDRPKLTIGARCRGSNYDCYFKGKLNDIRIYDHALSPLEVKKISQGLILHYPLNRNGWGNENNIAISKVANRSCTNFTYNTSTQEWTMTCPTGSSSWGYGIVINDRNIKWATGQAWVISMDVYVPKSIYWQRDINNKPDLSDISQYTGNDYDVQAQRYAYTNGVSGQRLQTGWNHIWFSQTAPSTYGLSNYSTNWGIVTTNETSAIDIKIKNIKGEVINVGSVIKPTPWCPNSVEHLELAV